MVRTAPTTKHDFYERWQALEFGNKLRTWNTQKELAEDSYRGLIVVRSKVPGGRCVYDIPAEEVITNPEWLGFVLGEMAPDKGLLFQGELTHATLRGYALFGSSQQAPMRIALANSGRQYYGLEALGRVKAYTNPKSFEMLMTLLDLYPEAVIEFGCYDRNLGCIPGHNTIIWEVRAY